MFFSFLRKQYCQKGALGADSMTQWVRCLPYKLEDPSLNTQNLHKAICGSAACNFGTMRHYLSQTDIFKGY